MPPLLTVLSLLPLATNVLAAVPSFDANADRYVNIPEDTPVGTVIKTFNVTDPDPGDSIHISVSDPTTIDYVTFNQTQGNNVKVLVILKRGLDRDRGSSVVEIILEANDSGGNKVKLHFPLYIDDVNDESPVFENEPYILKIKEKHPIGEVYHRISASDKDAGYKGYVTYSMQALSQSLQTATYYDRFFSIGNATGAVTLLKTLDFETNNYYKFNVTAQDMAPPYHRVHTLLIIHVLDVQDTPPFFTGIPYRTHVAENVKIGTSVMSVSAVDGDPSVSNQVAFKILDGDCSSFFNITSTGEIVTVKPIDRDGGEIKAKYGVCTFPIEAYEINGTTPQYGNTTTTTNVTIIIDDENDNNPRFVNDTVTFIAEIHENTPENIPITLTNPRTMDVYDDDQGLNSEMTLSLNTTDFIISPTTVQAYGSMLIRVKNKAILDYETRTSISFEVVAREVANSAHVATATVILNIIDTNDNSPVFEVSSYVFGIVENSPIGTIIGIIMATDKDSGQFGKVTYSLSGGNNEFKIDASTGAIYTESNMDREKRDVYYLSVTATDGGGRSTTTSVVIHVWDVNDNAPIFQRQEYTASIYEETCPTKPIITLTATDADKENTTNSEIRYSILDISEASVNLAIDERKGEIFLRSPIDYEMLNNTKGVAGEVLVIFRARDNGQPVLGSNVTMKLYVQDVNDNAPIFSSSVFIINVFENETSTFTDHTVILRLDAIDADRTPRNNQFDYFITNGSFNQFSINPATGELYITPNAKLDTATRDFYNITVTAIDHGTPPLSSMTHVLITIKGADNAAGPFTGGLSCNITQLKFNNQKMFYNGALSIHVRVMDKHSPGDYMCVATGSGGSGAIIVG